MESAKLLNFLMTHEFFISGKVKTGEMNSPARIIQNGFELGLNDLTVHFGGLLFNL